jgi:hypothetical protein
VNEKGMEVVVACFKSFYLNLLDGMKKTKRFSLAGIRIEKQRLGLSYMKTTRSVHLQNRV